MLKRLLAAAAFAMVLMLGACSENIVGPDSPAVALLTGEVPTSN